MDEYKSRLSAYLSDMVREELEKYDGGFTDEWNDQRKKNAEVLGYKLSGKSDIKEAVKDPKLKVGQKIRHKNDPRKVYTLKKLHTVIVEYLKTQQEQVICLLLQVIEKNIIQRKLGHKQ